MKEVKYKIDRLPFTKHPHFSVAVWTLAGGIGIGFAFYLVQALGMQSFSAPFEFMQDNWYFVLPLIIGFAIQMGLFRVIRLKAKQGAAAMAATGGTSTTAMLACCMHNLTLLFPIVGLSGLAVFFATYQNYVFGASLVFMLGGTFYMFKKYKAVSQH